MSLISLKSQDPGFLLFVVRSNPGCFTHFANELHTHIALFILLVFICALFFFKIWSHILQASLKLKMTSKLGSCHFPVLRLITASPSSWPAGQALLQLGYILGPLWNVWVSFWGWLSMLDNNHSQLFKKTLFQLGFLLMHRWTLNS